jgi:hypothetical protein
MTNNRFGSVLLMLAMVCIGLSGCFGTYFGTEMPKNLQQHGIAAKATILQIWDTGWTVNDDPVIGMRVEVQPDDRPAFESTIKRYIISRLEVPQFQAGRVLQVRFDPNDLTAVAVDSNQGSSPANDAASITSEDLDRIHGAGIMHLQTHYETPEVPASLRGLKVLMLDKIVGKQQSDESDQQVERGCRQASLSLFDQIGWFLVHDATDRHDLVIHAECTASAQFLTEHDSMYVLLPLASQGMRIETAAGELVEQLQPMARTVMCPVANQMQCAQAVKEYAASQLIEQIVHSASLASYAARFNANVH